MNENRCEWEWESLCAHIFRVVEFEVEWNVLIAFSFIQFNRNQAKREINGLNYLIKNALKPKAYFQCETLFLRVKIVFVQKQIHLCRCVLMLFFFCRCRCRHRHHISHEKWFPTHADLCFFPFSKWRDDVFPKGVSSISCSFSHGILSQNNHAQIQMNLDELPAKCTNLANRERKKKTSENKQH